MNALIAWALVVALAVVCLRLRRRLELVARADHELRGPVTALELALASLQREPGGLRRARAFETELDRMRAGLADLAAAREGRRAQTVPAVVAVERIARGAVAARRGGGRPIRFRWDAGPVAVRADRRRLAQVFGNLLSNALQHGSGRVELRGRTAAGALRVEVADEGPAPEGTQRGRGRGLSIASQAIEEAGGRLSVEAGGEGTVVAIELPVAER